MDEHPGIRFKRGPIEKITREKRYLDLKLLLLFTRKVVDKTMNTSEYPSMLRTFIKRIGDEAFHRTYVELKQAEDEQSNKGDNKE